MITHSHVTVFSLSGLSYLVSLALDNLVFCSYFFRFFTFSAVTFLSYLFSIFLSIMYTNPSLHMSFSLAPRSI